jgi:hypothetical protein
VNAKPNSPAADDRPASYRAHRLDHRLQTVEHPDQVDFQDHPEVREGFVFEELPGRHAGIVDQTVERAKLVEGELHCRRPLLRIGDVEMGVPRLRSEFPDQLTALVVEQVSEYHAAAAGEDVPCERGAEPAGATADQHDLSGQLT